MDKCLEKNYKELGMEIIVGRIAASSPSRASVVHVRSSQSAGGWRQSSDVAKGSSRR
jgi:hypothetical protein